MYTDGTYLLFISSGPVYLILFISSGPQRTQFTYPAVEGIPPAVIKGLTSKGFSYAEVCPFLIPYT